MPTKTTAIIQRIKAHIATAEAARKRLETFTPEQRAEAMGDVARVRWANKTPQQRSDHARMMNSVRWNKKRRSQAQ